jgi:hypothetical protein
MANRAGRVLAGVGVVAVAALFAGCRSASWTCGKRRVHRGRVLRVQRSRMCQPLEHQTGLRPRVDGSHGGVLSGSGLERLVPIDTRVIIVVYSVPGLEAA